jgi:hypothetical protein
MIYRKRTEARCQAYSYAITEFATSKGYTVKEFTCERQDSAVGMGMKPQAVRFRIRIRTGAGLLFFLSLSFPKRPGRLWGPSGLLFNG